LRAVFAQPGYQYVPPGILEEIQSPRRMARRQFMATLAAGVVLTVGTFAGGFGVGRSVAHPERDFNARLLDEVADYHGVYARETDHQVEVPASRKEHIEAWLGSALHRSLHVPDLSKHGLTFLGGRLLVVDGTPVAQLLYQWPGRQHEPLGLCVSFGSPVDHEVMTDSRAGLQQVLWRRNGYTYVMVGWTSQDILAELASYVMPTLDLTS
jgi:anti-sigma factor RsiW